MHARGHLLCTTWPPTCHSFQQLPTIIGYVHMRLTETINTSRPFELLLLAVTPQACSQQFTRRTRRLPTGRAHVPSPSYSSLVAKLHAAHTKPLPSPAHASGATLTARYHLQIETAALVGLSSLESSLLYLPALFFCHGQECHLVSLLSCTLPSRHNQAHVPAIFLFPMQVSSCVWLSLLMSQPSTRHDLWRLLVVRVHVKVGGLWL